MQKGKAHHSNQGDTIYSLFHNAKDVLQGFMEFVLGGLVKNRLSITSYC